MADSASQENTGVTREWESASPWYNKALVIGSAAALCVYAASAATRHLNYNAPTSKSSDVHIIEPSGLEKKLGPPGKITITD